MKQKIGFNLTQLVSPSVALPAELVIIVINNMTKVPDKKTNIDVV